MLNVFPLFYFILKGSIVNYLLVWVSGSHTRRTSSERCGDSDVTTRPHFYLVSTINKVQSFHPICLSWKHPLRKDCISVWQPNGFTCLEKTFLRHYLARVFRCRGQHCTVYRHGHTVYSAYPGISVPYMYRIKPSSTLCRYGYRLYMAIYSIQYI